MKRIAPRAESKTTPVGHSKRPQPTKARSFGFVLRGQGHAEALTDRPLVGKPLVGKPQASASPPSRERRLDRDEAPAADILRREDPRHELLRGDEFLYNPVLLPAATNLTPTQAAPQSSALERAQAAALAERVLHSVQVGRIQGGHLVRLRLSSDVEVQLRHCDGVLQATVVGEGDQGALARRLDTELRARGLRFDRVELG